MKILLALLVFFCLWSSPAEAQTTASCDGKGPFTIPAGQKLICSKAFYWSAPCNSTDFVYNGTFSGMPSWKLTAWETQDILIVGVEFALTGGPGTQSADVWWLMIGNNVVPDPMGFLAVGERHLRTWFPAGTGMPFPSIANSTANDYLDIHGGCTTGQGTAYGFLTIYYTVN